MGYELNIQREEHQPKITVKEWTNYIKSDIEFEQIESFSAEIEDGKSLTIKTPNAGLWKTEKGEVPFTFYENLGLISVKNPDKRIIRKMIAIANDLNAIVLGEEDEKYDEDNLNGRNQNSSNGRRWWEFWKKESGPKILKFDSENDLYLGDCFSSQNKEFDIGLVLYEIHQGIGGKYYSFAPVLLDNSRISIDKFKFGHFKFQPNLGSKKYGLSGIGIINQEKLNELIESHHKVGQMRFKKPMPKTNSISYLLDFNENTLTKFVEELDWNFSDEHRKKIQVQKLIR